MSPQRERPLERRRCGAVIVRTFSELCITVGTLIVLFVVYVLFWTGVKADTRHGRPDRPAPGPVVHGARVRSSPTETGRRAAAHPARARRRTASGQPFAIMYIPRLGFTWNKPVLEGTATGTLKKGLGHYADTARLGQTGQLLGRRPPPHLRRPVQGLPEAAAR